MRQRLKRGKQARTDTNRQAAIATLCEASERDGAKPPVFHDAWKDAFPLAGTGYFKPTAPSVEQCRNKTQPRPALTIAGASDSRDQLTFMTDAIDLGSVSMRSFVFHTA